MAKVKVPVFGTVGKAVFFDPQAGARAEAAVEALAQAISEGIGGTIAHRALQGLQVGDDHPQYAMWQAPETIQGEWNFQTIPLIQGETLAEYIEDVVGSGFFDFLQDTPSIKWTYFDTDAELEANVDLDWAPVWTNNHRWTDNDEIQLGTGGDLRLYHDGTNSFIRNDTGELQLMAGATAAIRVSAAGNIGVLTAPLAGVNAFTVEGSARFRRSTSGQGGQIEMIGGGAAINRFRYQNADASAARFAIRNDGEAADRLIIMETTGAIRIPADNQELQIGAAAAGDLVLYHDGTDSFIRNNTGVLNINEGATTVGRFDTNATAGNTRFMVYDVDNGTLERVSVGAADSGGAGFKVLRIPN